MSGLLPKNLLRWLLGLIFILMLLAAVSLWLASSQIIQPSRGKFSAYSRQWWDHPASHGLQISQAVASTGRIPNLVVKPDEAAGPGERGVTVRRQLAEMGLALAPFGKIQGTLVLLHGRTGTRAGAGPCLGGAVRRVVRLGHRNSRPLAQRGRTRRIQPAEWARKITAPVLVAHGTVDPLIAPARGRKLYAAIPSRKIWVNVPGGNHDHVLTTSKPLYATMCRWMIESMSQTTDRSKADGDRSQVFSLGRFR